MLHGQTAEDEGGGKHSGNRGQTWLSVEPCDRRGESQSEQHQRGAEPDVDPEERADLAVVDLGR